MGPEPQHLPPRLDEQGSYPVIPGTVASELLYPPRLISLWDRTVIRTAVPKTSVDEDCDLFTWEGYVNIRASQGN